MRYIIALALIALASPTFACELGAGVGMLSRDPYARAAHVQCVLRDKVEFSLDYFTAQSLYRGIVQVPEYPVFSVSRRWMYREGRALRPWVSLGLAFKEAQTCTAIPNAWSDLDAATLLRDKNCNRVLPLPVNFALGIGLRAGDFEFSIRHFSNSGFAAVNLGQDSLNVVFRFR